MSDVKRNLLEKLLSVVANDNLVGLNLAEYMEVVKDFTAYAYFSVLRDCNRLDLLDENVIAEEIKSMIVEYKRMNDEAQKTEAS